MPRRGVKLDSNLVKIKLEEITVPEWARRIYRDYLEESVMNRGVIVPIVVARVPNGRRNKYILVDGHGRYLMAKKRGDEYIYARIVPVEKEEDALLLAIELEFTRRPWSVQYTYEVIQELLKRGFDKKKIAEILHISRTTLYRYLWLSEMPEELLELFFSEALPLRAAEYIKKTLDAIEKSDISEDEKQKAKSELIQNIMRRPHDYERICLATQKAIKWLEETAKELAQAKKQREETEKPLEEARQLVERLEEAERKLEEELKTAEEAVERAKGAVSLVPASEIRVPETVEEKPVEAKPEEKEEKEEEKEEKEGKPEWVCKLEEMLKATGLNIRVIWLSTSNEVMISYSTEGHNYFTVVAKTPLQLRDEVRSLLYTLQDVLNVLNEYFGSQTE